jgi:hypothetical protein
VKGHVSKITASDTAAGKKQSIREAAARLVDEKVAEKQRELDGSGKSIDVDALVKRFKKVEKQVLDKLPDPPTAAQVERAVEEITQETLKGAEGVERTDLEISEEEVKGHISEAPPKQILRGRPPGGWPGRPR